MPRATAPVLRDTLFGEHWGNNDKWLQNLLGPFSEEVHTELYQLMERAGTWPAPIIVLDNTSGIQMISKGKPFPAFFLIEGHHRLEYIRALATLGKAKPEHEVWVATSA